MNKPMISLGILVTILQSCSGKPVGFQGETASISGNTSTTGDVNGRSMGNRDGASDDATASLGNGIEAQIIESENVEMEAANIYEGSDTTISIPGERTQVSNSGSNANGSNGSNANGSNANGSNANSSNGSNANGSNANGSNGSNANGSNANSSNGSNANGSNTNGSNTNGSNTNGSNTNGSNANSSNANSSNGSNANGSNTNGSNTSSTSNTTAPLTLSIQVPSTSLRSGSAPMQATAKITGQTTAADVIWTAKTDMGKSTGTIDSNGLYTAPASGGGYDITLTATLDDDASITASVTIKIVVPEQIFVGCQKGSEFFPITADVYQLPAQTTKLPNFSTIGAKLTTVCMDQYNVAPRDWSTGFPGLTGLFEWFALRTSTHLVAASDGIHTFKLNADDGAKLYIDGQLVIDNDGQHAPTAKEASLSLTAGDHVLSIDYFQGPRYQIALELYWKIPGSSTYVYVPKASFK